MENQSPIFLPPPQLQEEPSEAGVQEVTQLRQGKSRGWIQHVILPPTGLAGVSEVEYGRDQQKFIWLVKTIQLSFRTGHLTEAALWSVMVITPKGGDQYWGIGLTEVIWKLIISMANHRVAEINIYDELQSFRQRRVMLTEGIEANIFQHLLVLRRNPLLPICGLVKLVC